MKKAALILALGLSVGCHSSHATTVAQGRAEYREFLLHEYACLQPLLNLSALCADAIPCLKEAVEAELAAHPEREAECNPNLKAMAQEPAILRFREGCKPAFYMCPITE